MTTDRESRRERKRRETRNRIAETALNLFIENGYESTTLEDIAQGAGISRRTFFSYFGSKDDLMLAWQAASWEVVSTELLTSASPDKEPLEVVRETFVSYISNFEAKRMRAIDEVMRASKTLQARKLLSYANQEESLFATLCQVWTDPERRPALRVVAMISMGALKLALRAYGETNDDRTPASHFDEVFVELAQIVHPSKEI